MKKSDLTPHDKPLKSEGNDTPGLPHFSISQEEVQKILSETRERLKELGAINKTTAILKQEKPAPDMLKEIVRILPPAWQYPDDAVARIKYGKDSFTSSSRFRETQWYQKKSFETIDAKEGSIEVFYLNKHPNSDEGPFLIEERDLINNLSSLIQGYLNTYIGKELLHKKVSQSEEETSESGKTHAAMSRQLLQKFLIKHHSDRDIYHDLMPNKVREILLVANLYDAYIIEQEGRFFEQVRGEYYQLNLSSAPRITGVSTPEEALEKLQEKHFDMVIVMMGVDKTTPIQLSRIIKKIYHNLPIFLLLNNNSDIGLFEDGNKPISSIDKIFVWNGDSNVFLAMVKFIEDRMNVENDIRIGMVRVILLVEDSAKYYSRYLPILYSIVIEQTRQLIEEVNTDETYKLLKMRVRPKILLASNYTEALTLFDKYRDNLLCLISDVKFEKNGKLDEYAGLSLVSYVREQMPDLPIVLQSSDTENAHNAYLLKSTFINKNSETLRQDLQSFINYYLGFGNFVYRDEEGRKEIAVARSMKEFQSHLKSIPIKSLIYHARKNHFSHWLMARGEIQIAKKIKPLKVEDFECPGHVRQYMIDIIEKCIQDRLRGKVINFEESALLDETNVVSLALGSLGGKGRGLAFINMLINNFSFNDIVPDINICTPKTTIIGTEEFELFMQRNKLYEKITGLSDYDEIKKLFVDGDLSGTLIKRLKIFLNVMHKPLAIRSSSLFEDSLMQPFAGIFDTYLLPNNHPDLKERLRQTMNAIKLVFASIFSPTAQAYFQAVNYKVEEEKMAVVIQEVAGNPYGEYFYPHISGVAQSYNFYPYSYMKPDEGFAVAAVGLGKYVVEGEKTYRFSPAHPQLEIYTPKDLFKNSQLHFYAIDMSKKNLNLLEGEDAGLKKLEISAAEAHGTLKHSASVYDFSSERTIPGITQPGPRVINFANILKYDYIPMAKTIEVILDIVSEAMGSPIEIEFAIDLTRDAKGKASFYLLQIKPLIKNINNGDINLDVIDNERLLLYSENGMGNGIVDNVSDVIYVDMKKFDKLKTEKMRDEIEQLNRKMAEEGRKYILVGPGRWGTRDRFIGIPVAWSNISNARIIVEVSMEDFPLDASLGSHFFHNVISMNVGYLSVKHNDLIDYINWEILDNMEPVHQTQYFKHVRFDKPLEIIMDGKKRASLVYLPKNETPEDNDSPSKVANAIHNK
ncbi:MAG: PEP/pyruvate-binding domain-containing protein [Bacteroidota bacterium]